MINLLKILLSFILLSFIQSVLANPPPAIQLATKYRLEHSIVHYWVSEKLDGVRGYWNGKELLTKNGNILNAPIWFTEKWPNHAIEGELWIERHKFEQTISCVKQKKATPCWKNIRFMVFDLPQSDQIFSERILQIKHLAKTVNSPYFHYIQQFKVSSLIQLNKILEEIVEQQGEGLMLHYENALYTQGRTRNIMKLKPYQDAEAVVIKHFKGKGKYKNMLGAIQVKTSDGIVFKIGSGFSDNERKNPPPIGSVITFKYIGTTLKGVPKFASFLRIRQ